MWAGSCVLSFFLVLFIFLTEQFLWLRGLCVPDIKF